LCKIFNSIQKVPDGTGPAVPSHSFPDTFIAYFITTQVLNADPKAANRSRAAENLNNIRKMGPFHFVTFGYGEKSKPKGKVKRRYEWM
jgi:hypothetical protein